MLPNFSPDTIFQQDGAPAHKNLAVEQVLNENYLISGLDWKKRSYTMASMLPRFDSSWTFLV